MDINLQFKFNGTLFSVVIVPSICLSLLYVLLLFLFTLGAKQTQPIRRCILVSRPRTSFPPSIPRALSEQSRWFDLPRNEIRAWTRSFVRNYHGNNDVDASSRRKRAISLLLVVIKELIESSSFDSDEELDALYALETIRKKRVKLKNYVEEVMPRWTGQELKLHFR